MSTNKKPTGIIYRAFNKISGKSYIGQTIQTLEIRKKEHIRKAGKLRTVFSKALLKYPESSWIWSVLIEVPIEELDEYERYFIKDLGTFKAEYNMTMGGQLTGEGCPRWDSNIYELYNPKYGVVVAQRCVFIQLDPMLKNLLNLTSGKFKYMNGWVLASNKDKYDEILGIYEFYHIDFGIIKCTSQELDDNYIQPENSKRLAKELTRKANPSQQVRGWILAKNLNIYSEIMSRRMT